MLTDEEWQAVEAILRHDPDAEALIPGLGGIRELRVAFAGRGKRGSARTIYFHATAEYRVYFLLAYAKNRQEEITSEQRRAILRFLTTRRGR